MKKNNNLKFIKSIIRSKTSLFIGLGVLAVIVVVILDFYDSSFSKHDILVEFHGLVFDLFVFGVILTVYDTLKEKREKEKSKENKKLELIQRYTEEINDYKFWKCEESMFRTRGLIERLVNLGATDLNLSHCYLYTNSSLMFKDMKNWKFSFADMREGAFALSNMTNTEFYSTKLINAHFNKVNLTKSKFDSANLFNTKFVKCIFEDAELDNAIVNSVHWFEYLIEEKNTGIEALMKKYKITSQPEIINEIEFYRVKKR